MAVSIAAQIAGALFHDLDHGNLSKFGINEIRSACNRAAPYLSEIDHQKLINDVLREVVIRMVEEGRYRDSAPTN
jgi:hypothetical protein